MASHPPNGTLIISPLFEHTLAPPTGDLQAIGLIGAGFIVDDCHLPAYRQAGFPVTAICSRSTLRANEVAAKHCIPTVHANWHSLLDDETISVIDIAVPPLSQPEIILEACNRSHIHGILAQKPLAMDPIEGARLVHACHQANKVLVVNQNMRHDQAIRACTSLVRSGWLGEPILATINLRAIPHWMPWSEGLRSLTTYILSIHHLDTFRAWLGTPDRVMASTRPDPRTLFPHSDGINLYILEYDKGPRALGIDDVWVGPIKSSGSEGCPGQPYVQFRVEGTEGWAEGTIGWPAWPARQPSTLDFASRNDPTTVQRPRWREVWFPDAFAGPMSELLWQLKGGPVAELSGMDNLQTLALCEAVLVSGREKRTVEVKEFLPQTHQNPDY